MISFVKRIRNEFFSRQSPRGKITVSIHPFVPKAWTPFQWSPMEDVRFLTTKLDSLQSGLQGISQVRVIPKSPRRAILQGLFSVGDRRIGEALCCKVSDRLHWKTAWKKAGIDPDFYVYREKTFEEILPWEIIDTGMRKRMLWDEYQKAKNIEA